ncbi:sugar phosphate nucleotidyltransferase [Paenibacillus contaminans]|uniref:Mannose-1-phosphate guanylyltransferase n=1 Tax=Paenibacillus contaminans TaxID=450362 RepID=A0A329LV92_9BACL|nr:sugar phosphate nucleotidyltransferase [Paenibacillus contaminans]RAV10473.1 mannose-1-phosphate guanylyltransferase [Paenibacillus contaminans]
MKAVIMAGGKGTRLRPLTSNTPKPMVPLLDRPVMEYTIELLKKHGITEIAVTVQYLPEVIRQYFGDGSDFGVKLHYFEENSPLGTAGSVKNAEAFLDETFIVISGDALTDFDLSEAIAYHRRNRAVGTLVLTTVENPLEFGVVMTNDGGEIIRFLEKPSWGEVFSDTVNTGIYILETEIFSYFESGKEFDFSKDLFPILMHRQRPLYGYVAKGYWSDIGNLAQYRQTQFDMLDGKVEVTITGTPMEGGIWIGEDAKIGPDAKLSGPCFIGNGCVLEQGVNIKPYTVVGAGSVLAGSRVSLERTVLWNNNYIEQGVEMKGGTLCHHVVAKLGAIVREGAVVGDFCTIGIKSVVQPGIKVFPNKSVEDYTTLNHSLIWGEKNVLSLFGQFGVKGICGIDMTTSFANRLAMAYGTMIPAGAAVGIGHDSSRFAAIIAGTFASSLHASGIHTYEFGTGTSSVSRHAVHRLDCAGGIHVRMLEDGSDNQLVIEFMDENGLPISKGAERKIENAYAQEDFRLIKSDRAGSKKICPNACTLYSERLIGMVEGDFARYTIVVEVDNRNLSGVLPGVLKSLNCKVIQLNRMTSSPAELGQWVRSAKADLGVRLDANGQNMILVTDQGEAVDDELLSILQIMIQIRNKQDETLYVPVHVPNIVEELAGRVNRQVIHTKADMRSIMEGCQHEGFHVYADAIYTMIAIMQMTAERNLTVSELIGTIPSFALLKEKVACPWKEKGMIMRLLMEETKEKQVELIDGIKIFHDGGWTLILPDNEEPVFRVFANAANQQAARELAVTYTQKIQDYRQQYCQ